MLLDLIRSRFVVSYKTKERTPLCELAIKYKTDKVRDIRHDYTPVYHRLLKEKRQTVETVLEIGIGHKGRDVKNPGIVNMAHVQDYTIGASLFMWRDYFSKARIFGIDISPKCMFSAERITTALIDQSRPRELISFAENIVQKPIDLIIDDGSHEPTDQIASLLSLAPYLRKGGGIYVIEDVSPTLHKRWRKYFTRPVLAQLKSLQCTVERVDLRAGNPDIADEYLIVVRR